MNQSIRPELPADSIKHNNDLLQKENDILKAKCAGGEMQLKIKDMEIELLKKTIDNMKEMKKTIDKMKLISYFG